jgi:hypothetical protein
MARSDLGATWRSEIERSLAFLLDEGYAAPVFDEKWGSAAYVSGDFTITAHFGGRYKELSVEVTSMTDPKLQADLSDLFVGAGLGSAQAVGHIGRSGHSIQKAVASQAAALRALLPFLDEPSVNLLEQYGRVVPSPGAARRSLDGIESQRFDS